MNTTQLKVEKAKQAKLTYKAPKAVKQTLVTAGAILAKLDKAVALSAWKAVIVAWEKFHRENVGYSKLHFVRCIHPGLSYHRDGAKGYKADTVWRAFENAEIRLEKAKTSKATKKGGKRTRSRVAQAHMPMNSLVGILLDCSNEGGITWSAVERIVRRHIPEEAFEDKPNKALEAYSAPTAQSLASSGSTPKKATKATATKAKAKAKAKAKKVA